MYADTNSMQNDWWNYLSQNQTVNYNTANNLTPQALKQKIESALLQKNPLVDYELETLVLPQNQKTCTYLNLKLKNWFMKKRNQWKNLLKN
jgi:hypothetical protein